MKDEKVTIDAYKELTCDMIRSMTDEKFIRQIYSIVLRQTQK